MAAKRNRALMGLAAVAALAAATPAGATVVLVGASTTVAGTTFGIFNLASYFSDAQGRTFTIGAATLSATAHSDPNYGPGVVTTVDTFGLPQIVGTNPPTFRTDVSRVVTTTFSDNLADTLTLSDGIPGSGAQSVSGTVSQVLDTSESSDGGSFDSSNPIFPGVQHTTVTNVTVHHAVYGLLSLSEALNVASLSTLNQFATLFYSLTPGTGGLGGINVGPFDPTQSFNTDQFTVDGVTLAFDLVQTGGPPPEAPQLPGGVPEPAAWALMILGLGAVGGSLRRRRALSVLA